VNTQAATFPENAARLLAAAPHRLLFLVGATNVLAAMGWWAAWLVAARWHVFEASQPPLPAGWMHAIIMQYQVLPSFIFGFLLTVFPRWLGLPALTPRHYLPVGMGLLGGQLLTLAGLAGSLPLLRAGALFTIAGWSIGMFWLARLTVRAPSKSKDSTPWHAFSVLFGLSFGLMGLVFYLLPTVRSMRRWPVAIKFGGIPMLLPIYFTVCHRMIPPSPTWSCAITRWSARCGCWERRGRRCWCTWRSSCVMATNGCGSRTHRWRCCSRAC
jgi:uncharacterized protein involved in response to NO